MSLFGKNVTNRMQPNRKKSVFWAYLLWLIGGVFGLHHFYLGRDLQAFVWWSTLGGFCGMGWLYDLFHIPRYVDEANMDPLYLHKLLQQYTFHKVGLLYYNTENKS